MTRDSTESIVEDTAVNETLLPILTFDKVWGSRMEAKTA